MAVEVLGSESNSSKSIQSSSCLISHILVCFTSCDFLFQYRNVIVSCAACDNSLILKLKLYHHGNKITSSF